MIAHIEIRDIRHGENLTVWQAIARLCDGTPVTIAVAGPAEDGGGPGGEPRPGRDIEIAPPSYRPFARETEPRVTPRGPGGLTFQDAALHAEALTLAANLAAYTGPHAGCLGQAAAIGAAHGRDAARRALATATPGDCQELLAQLAHGGEFILDDLYPTPALGGEHGICYDAADLAADTGLDPADGTTMYNAESAYFDEARRVFWDEAERIARGRAAQARRAPGMPGSRMPAELAQ